MQSGSCGRPLRFWGVIGDPEGSGWRRKGEELETRILKMRIFTPLSVSKHSPLGPQPLPRAARAFRTDLLKLDPAFGRKRFAYVAGLVASR